MAAGPSSFAAVAAKGVQLRTQPQFLHRTCTTKFTWDDILRKIMDWLPLENEEEMLSNKASGVAFRAKYTLGEEEQRGRSLEKGKKSFTSYIERLDQVQEWLDKQRTFNLCIPDSITITNTNGCPVEMFKIPKKEKVSIDIKGKGKARQFSSSSSDENLATRNSIPDKLRKEKFVKDFTWDHPWHNRNVPMPKLDKVIDQVLYGKSTWNTLLTAGFTQHPTVHLNCANIDRSGVHPNHSSHPTQIAA